MKEFMSHIYVTHELSYNPATLTVAKQRIQESTVQEKYICNAN